MGARARRAGFRVAHGHEWDVTWHDADEDRARPAEKNPLALTEFLRAPSTALLDVSETEDSGGHRVFALEFDLRAMEHRLSPLQRRALDRGAETVAVVQVAIDGGFPVRIARFHKTHEGREMWTVLELERCEAPFDDVDLFARWDAG